MKITSEHLKILRYTEGLTQEELSKILGVSTRTLQNYECATKEIPEIVQRTIELLIENFLLKTVIKNLTNHFGPENNLNKST